MREPLATFLNRILIATLVLPLCLMGDQGAQEDDAPPAFSLEDLDSLLLGEDLLTVDLDGESNPEPGGANLEIPAGPDSGLTPTDKDPDADAGALPPEVLELLEVPNWIQEIIVQGGIGYNDNPLLTSLAKESSLYSTIEAEYVGIRLPRNGAGQFFLYGFGEYIRYANVTDLDHEIVAIIQANYKQDIFTALGSETALQYAYNDRVFGLSPLEDELITTQVRVHQFNARQGFTVRFPAAIQLKTDFYLEHNLFVESTNDYWKPGNRSYLERRFLNQALRVQAGADFHWRNYDERPARNSNGFVIPDTVVQWQSLEPFLSLKWKTQGDNPFNVSTRIGYRWNEDDAEGYDDFTRLTATLRAGKSWGPWEFEADGSVSHYQYPNRPVSSLDSRAYYISQWISGFQIRRNFSPQTAVILKYELEISRSLRESESYTANRGEIAFTFSL